MPVLLFLLQFSARDEASSARVGTKVYVIGGVGDETVEYLDLSGYDIEADEAEYIKSEKSINILKFTSKNLNL